MKAGVKIYEYKPGFVHSKLYLADDLFAIMGSVNLDYRSLAHNFENAVWSYGTQTVLEVKKDIEKVFEDCVLIEKGMVKMNLLQSIWVGAIRIFAPLL
jgi:cardiolipin synthase